ncbi:hypothetical protein ABZ612_16310 [Streptomyces avermitilis]|uniref:hypothetical protein n=1 Tax=Streptomyces avermitilis TaxID=33903 RepID=UPI0033CDF9E1
MTATPRPDRITELHTLCREDYAKGQSQRASVNLAPSYAPASPTACGQTAEPADLDVAIRVAQQLLDSDHALSLREALRLLLRALGAEPVAAAPQLQAPVVRCPAAHPQDPTPCDGPPVVTVLDANNAGADGCEHHAVRLLASLDGGRVYALPDAPDGAAIRVFKAADTTRPFVWFDGPRVDPSQLSRAENRRRGERP